MESLSSQFGWGPLVNLVPDSHAGGFEKKPIIHQRKALTIQVVQIQAWKYFSEGFGSAVNFRSNRPLKMMDIDPESDVSHMPVFYKGVKCQKARAQQKARVSTSLLRRPPGHEYGVAGVGVG